MRNLYSLFYFSLTLFTFISISICLRAESHLILDKADSLNMHFPESYLISRSRFRKKINQVLKNIQTGSLSKFFIDSEKDVDLTVDYFYVKATHKRDKLIVLMSGVHGPEAYVGSALLNLFTEKYLSRINSDNTSVLLVHSLNPYGFKYNRRVTENNVNLNRNFSVSNQLYGTKNSSYSKLNSILNPKVKAKSNIWSFIKRSFVILSKIVTGESTVQSLQKAIAGGQYQYSKGIEYGGSEPEPQVTYFKQFLSKVVSKYSEIYFVDIHTGLGKASTLHLIVDPYINDASKVETEKLFRGLSFDKGIKQSFPTSKGFYAVDGGLTAYMNHIVPKDKLLVSFVAEFGTIGDSLFSKLVSLDRIIKENQGYHHGYVNHKDKTEIQNKFNNLFYPNDNVWKQNVINKSNTLFEQLLLILN